MANKKMPIHENRLGAIRVSLWSNVNLDGSRWHSVSFATRHNFVEQRSIGTKAKSLVQSLSNKFLCEEFNQAGGHHE